MGEVYRARDPRLGREVAIKVLPEAVRADSDRLRRFEREARAVGGLTHPNIVTVHDVGSDRGVRFVVSELLEGQTLRERMRGTALPADDVLDQGLQVSRGLTAAHEKGIVHRDLKPENLFLTRSGVVKILDFGLAKWTGAEPPIDRGAETASCAATTEPGVVMGTVAYMSPEQLRGEAVGDRSDVFSLGVVLHEMLGGRHPFKGSTPADTMTAILTRDPPELHGLEPAPPTSLLRLLMRCLAKDPGQRPSARELEEGLGRERGLLTPESGTAGMDATRTSWRQTLAAPRRLRMRVWWLAALGLVGVAVGGLAIATRVAGDRNARRAVLGPPPAFSTFARDYWQRELGGPPSVISFDQPGVSLNELFRHTSEAGGINVLVMPGTAGEVRGRYLDLPWPDVLDTELKEHALAWSYSDGAAMIAPPAELRRIWGTDLLLFTVPRPTAGGILETTRALLSGFGRAAALELGNGRAGVIVADSPLHVEYVGAVLARLGLIAEPRRQVVDRMLCVDPAIGAAPQAQHVHFTYAPAAHAPGVSLHWESRDVVQALAEVASAAGKRLRLPAGVSGRATLDLSDIPPEVALHYVLAVNGLECTCDADLVTAYPVRSRADNAVSTVIDIKAPTRAEDLRTGLDDVLLRSPVSDQHGAAAETLEVLPAGNALRFVGRLSTAREIRLIVDAFSER